MLFNSYTFWLFYLAVFILYWAGRRHHSYQNTLLLIASYVFYGAWDWRFLFLILTSTLIDFFLAQAIHDSPSQRKRKLLLALSIGANLSILGFFKYYNFFSAELNDFLMAIGLNSMMPTLDIILPVGISFYTFQTMSYSIDVYRNETRPTRNLRDYALYVSFFPQLVAGPIERSSNLLPQVVYERTWKEDYFLDGLYLILYGLFLKVVIADNMAAIVNTVFAQDVSMLSGTEILLGVYAFAFQIYGDFAGYSSIARGIAKWLGFELMVNFRMPYFATNPSDFWRRWHISLSSWFQSYVYIPLGGNRHGTLKTHRNLFVTMFLSGLWHGAAWTFVAWGLLHSVYLSLYHLLRLKHLGEFFAGRFGPLPGRLIAIVVTFHLVCIGWLLFRAESIEQAGTFFWHILTHQGITAFASGVFIQIAFYVLPLLIYEIWTERRGLMVLPQSHAAVQVIFYGYIFMMLLFFPSPTAHEFIYFQF